MAKKIIKEELPPSEGETTEHTVTKQDLENNPELAQEGVQEGDTVEIHQLPLEAGPNTPPAEEEPAVEEEKPKDEVAQIEPAPEEVKASKVVDPEADSDTIYGGDAVMLKSGGPKMTVDAAFNTPTGRKVHCSWKIAGKYTGEVFPLELLHKLGKADAKLLDSSEAKMHEGDSLKQE